MLITFVIANPTHWFKKIGSTVIREVDESSGSHFAIILRSFSGNWVYESVFPRARRMALSEWQKEYEIVKDYHFKVPENKAYEVLVFLDNLVNRPYSVSQLIAIGIASVSTYMEYVMRATILNHQKALICTEAGSRFMQRFMNIKLNESHDMIGVFDMEGYLDELMETEIVWKAE